MEVFLCITNPHPEPGVWALKNNLGKQSRAWLSVHTQKSHIAQKQLTTSARHNVNNLANYVKKSWPERMRSCKTQKKN